MQFKFTPLFYFIFIDDFITACDCRGDRVLYILLGQLSTLLKHWELSLLSSTNVLLFSSFCRREFDVALHQNITVKRKKRLIVLMMLTDPGCLLRDDVTASVSAAAAAELAGYFLILSSTYTYFVEKQVMLVMFNLF